MVDKFPSQFLQISFKSLQKRRRRKIKTCKSGAFVSNGWSRYMMLVFFWKLVVLAKYNNMAIRKFSRHGSYANK